MTYEEYSAALIYKLTLIKQKMFATFNTLKGSKGYLDTSEQRLYLLEVAEFLSTANQCESVLNLFLESKVNPFDEIMNPSKDNQSDKIKRAERVCSIHDH